MTEPRGRTPSTGRDASWLVSADLLAVALAFIGQIILTHALLAEHYGWMVLAIDLYASLFLVVDLGLPTLLARDALQMDRSGAVNGRFFPRSVLALPAFPVE